MEEALIAGLLADAGFAALAPDRAWPMLRPQGSALPGATVTRITGAPGYTYQGSDGLADSLVQVDCWGRTYAEAKTLARAVKAFAADWTGAKAVFVENERDGRERVESETLFRVSIDLRVFHKA